MATQIMSIIIDPKACTVTSGVVDDTLEGMQAMVGGNIEMIRADFGPDHQDEVLWVNEEGKLDENYHYQLKGCWDIVSGKSFICGITEAGDNADTKLTVDYITSIIKWLPHLDGAQLLV